MDKSVVNLSASFNLEFYWLWEPTILIGQPVIVFYQESTKRVDTIVSSGIRLGFLRRHRKFCL